MTLSASRQRRASAARPSPVASNARRMFAVSSAQNWARSGRETMADMRNRSAPWRRGILERALAAFVVADADGFLDAGEKNLAVADFPGLRGFQNRFDGGCHQMVGQDHLEFDLGEQVHGVLAAAIHLGVPLLAAVP